MPHPVAYLRRSYVDPDSPGDISLEAQRAAVRRLAAADGHNGDVVEYNDWGISADVAKAAKRTDYVRLLADMEGGAVSELYAFDVDRLYRDPRDLIRLQDAAQQHRVRIVTTGGPLAIGEGDDPAAEAFAFIGSVFGRMELQKAKKRARAARDARRTRGDRMGHAPIGFLHVKDATGRIVRVPDPERPLEPVLDAYRAAGTVLGAVRLLNERKIPGPKGGTWHLSALTRVLEQNAPELLPMRSPSGKRIRATALLSQLVRCHCGHTMTPNTHRGQLYCSHGPITPGHGRYVVQEAALLPWLKAEAARLRTPDAVELAERSEARREALEARRQRIIDNYEDGKYGDGLIGRQRRDAKIAEVNDDLGRLDAAQRVVAIPTLDWTWPPPTINEVLRSMWEYVQLDVQLRPVRAEWAVPEWRAA